MANLTRKAVKKILRAARRQVADCSACCGSGVMGGNECAQCDGWGTKHRDFPDELQPQTVALCETLLGLLPEEENEN